VVAAPTLEVIAQNALNLTAPNPYGTTEARCATGGSIRQCPDAGGGADTGDDEQSFVVALSPPPHVVVMLDAKRNHVYAAAFARQGTGYAPLGEPVEADPVEFLNTQPPNCFVIGEGAQVYRERIAQLLCRIAPEHLHAPRAEVVYRLGFELARLEQFVEPRMLIPLYVRPPEPEEKLARS
jgi:tRNA threonylcarbamoyladenosine biosynthesis protein TsaB